MADLIPLRRPTPLSARDRDEQQTALEITCPYAPCSAPPGEPCRFVGADGRPQEAHLTHPIRINRARQEPHR